MTSYKICSATEADVPELLSLIYDLAVYEKEPDAVVATPELMIENVFRKKYAECLIARKETSDGSKGEAVGLALYFFTYSTWLGIPGLYLEDLFVKEEHRAQGLGKRLFGELGAIAKERKCGRVEWRVLKASLGLLCGSPARVSSMPPLVWNKPSIDFYVECLKADSLDEWDTMRIEGDEGIERLVAMRK